MYISEFESAPPKNSAPCHIYMCNIHDTCDRQLILDGQRIASLYLAQKWYERATQTSRLARPPGDREPDPIQECQPVSEPENKRGTGRTSAPTLGRANSAVNIRQSRLVVGPCVFSEVSYYWLDSLFHAQIQHPILKGRPKAPPILKHRRGRQTPPPEAPPPALLAQARTAQQSHLRERPTQRQTQRQWAQRSEMPALQSVAIAMSVYPGRASCSQREQSVSLLSAVTTSSGGMILRTGADASRPTTFREHATVQERAIDPPSRSALSRAEERPSLATFPASAIPLRARSMPLPLT